MAYRSIQIPFAQGQDERYDRKLLPDGIFRAVYNMRLERDGRMAKRQKLVEKSTTDPDGNTVSPRHIGFVENNGTIVRNVSNLLTTVRQWADTADGNDENTVAAEGVLPTNTRVEHFYSAQRNVNPGFYGDDAHLEGDFRSQLWPNVDIDASGQVIFAYVQGTDIHVEIREPRELKVLKRITIVNDLGDNASITMKMVASKVTNRVAIFWQQPVLSTYQQVLAVYKTDGDHAVVVDSDVIQQEGTQMSPSFDMIARPNQDSFILAREETSGGNLLLEEYSFSNSTATVIDSVSTASPYDAGPVFSVHCDTKRFYWSYSGMSSLAISIRSSAWGGGSAQTQTISDVRYLSPPAWFVSTSTSSSVFVLCDPLDGAISDGAPVLRIYDWDHTDNSRQARGTDAPVPTGPASSDHFGWNHEGPVTQPVHYGSGSTAVIQFACHATMSQFTGTASSTRGYLTQSQCYVVQVEDDSNIHTDTLLHQAGVRYRDTLQSSDALELDLYERAALPRPLRYTLDGVERCIWPVVIDSGQTAVDAIGDEERITSVVWSRTSAEVKHLGKELRQGEAYIPGGTLHVCDGERVLQGFMHPPQLRVSTATSASGNIPNDTDYLFSAVFEYKDANGRVWRSAASDTITLTTPSPDPNPCIMSVHVTAPIGLTGQERGAQVVVYASNAGGTVLYRRWVFQMEQGKWAAARGGSYSGFTTLDDAPTGTPVLYTQDGTLGNDPPPACEFVTATRNRIWIGGLAERSWIQASKVLNDTLGPEWSNLDSFKVFLPKECTGLASMDDSVVAFTRDNVYVIGGSGPDNAGVGTFGEPQLIPGSSGCINHKSVISTEMGVFYQSQRGIELFPRGFASPIWVGENVRDTLESFGHCWGVAQSPKDWTVRWLFGDNSQAPTASRVVVFDLRAKSWYVFDYEEAFTVIGNCEGDMFLANSSGAYVESQLKGREALAVHEGWLETGDMRFEEIQGWQSGRRVILLGQFGGRDCTVKLDFAFDGTNYLPQDTYTWTLTSAERGSDVPVSLEQTLPVQLFSSARFKITVTSLDDTEGSAFTFAPNGMTVQYTPRPEGPRLAARDTA